MRYNDDPDADLLVVGRDAKGREQRIYHPSHTAAAAAAKFQRIQSLNAAFATILQEVSAGRGDAADVTRLIMSTGIRPGSDAETGGSVKAYGATTLEGRHVVEGEAGNVRLRFVGKKGVSLDIPVLDPAIAAMLLERKRGAGDDGRLFPVSQRALLDYVSKLDGGGFKTKDARTLLGTSLAMRLAKEAPEPADAKSYQKAVMAVAKKVSEALGNTPTVALQSYIAPEVFGRWRMAAGV